MSANNQPTTPSKTTAPTKWSNQAILTYAQQPYLKKQLPIFRAGDYVAVYNKIIENNKVRIQRFEGVVLRVRGSLTSTTFIVRKETNGYYSEKNFQLHSPQIERIEVLRYGKIRRAYLTYLRGRSSKLARIKERKPKKAVLEHNAAVTAAFNQAANNKVQESKAKA